VGDKTLGVVLIRAWGPGPYGFSSPRCGLAQPSRLDFSTSQFYRDGTAFGEQLEQECDRGAALVGLAFLDELLNRLFEAKMRGGEITKKLLKYPGALSTASARSDVAYRSKDLRRSRDVSDRSVISLHTPTSR
jgi:hypothetical protein